jgi:predicted esterase
MRRYLAGLTLAATVSGLGFGVFAGGMGGGMPGGGTRGGGPAATGAAATASAPLAPGVSRVTSPAVGKTAGQSRRAGGDPVDDRVELREYGFKDTNENLPYAVFVSTKVTKEKKAPLVLALHGMGGNHGTFMRTACVDEAEKNGYILVGAMGYSPNGSFGMNFGMGGRGGPGARGARGPATTTAPATSTAPAAGRVMGPLMGGEQLVFVGAGGGMPGGMGGMGGGMGGMGGAAGGGMGGMGGMGGGRGGTIGGTAVTDSARVTELSEKDALTVLEMMCKEFNVDENRIYLMGHSLGGGGSLAMGEKYADKWAGVAALAPAAFGFTWTKESKLKNVPLLIAQGEGDTMVRPAGSQQLVDQMKGLGFRVELKMFPGLDHGGIIAGAQPEVFKFFGQHVKGEPKPETKAATN